MRAAFLTSFFLLFSTPASAACTYDVFDWDTKTRAAVNRKTLSFPSPSSARYEIDQATGCTVCKEDQIRLALPGAPEIHVCSKLASKLEPSLVAILGSGFVVKELSGYRVGKTRGETDAKGLRTQFSNHSYGTAIDFNASWNGLYHDCEAFNPKCRLVRGGPWMPTSPFGIDRGKAIVQIMTRAGFKWGGAIAGRQKDFMHFSLTGY